jgi:hypothetical protein
MNRNRWRSGVAAGKLPDRLSVGQPEHCAPRQSIGLK